LLPLRVRQAVHRDRELVEPTFARPQTIEAEIAPDLPEPGAKRRLAAVGVQMLPGAHKDLLHYVLRVFAVVEETKAERVYLLPIRPTEQIECLLISRPRRGEAFLFAGVHLM